MLSRLCNLLKHNHYYLEIRNDYILITLKSAFTRDFFNILRQSTFFRYTVLLDIFAVDYPDQLRRFQITYSTLSLQYGKRLFIRTCIADNVGISSIKGVFLSADWVEREIWDLFGVFFLGSVSLRRILTDYGFVGHPLRRDFPLSGYLAIRWSHTLSKIVSEPVTLTQEFRFFEFGNPWQER